MNAATVGMPAPRALPPCIVENQAPEGPVARRNGGNRPPSLGVAYRHSPAIPRELQPKGPGAAGHNGPAPPTQREGIGSLLCGSPFIFLGNPLFVRTTMAERESVRLSSNPVQRKP